MSSEPRPPSKSSLERRVERIEQAFVKHFNINLDEHDAREQDERERGAEVEQARVEAEGGGEPEES